MFCLFFATIIQTSLQISYTGTDSSQGCHITASVLILLNTVLLSFFEIAFVCMKVLVNNNYGGMTLWS